MKARRQFAVREMSGESVILHVVME